MLLPSALPCDGRQPALGSRQRPLLQRFMPFSNTLASPESLPVLSTRPELPTLPLADDATCISGLPSPLLSPASISSGIQSTCRALQALLGVAPSSTTVKPRKYNQVPSPPIEASFSSQRISIQDRQTDTVQSLPPSRGKNKRTRNEYEPLDVDALMDVDGQDIYQDRHYTFNSDSAYASNSSSPDLDSVSTDSNEKCFSTPKRQRRLPGPTNLPFGLERQDFADLEGARVAAASQLDMNMVSPQSKDWSEYHDQSESIPEPTTPDKLRYDTWTAADDAQLVTAVFEKMAFSRRDWEECAKVLGVDGEASSLSKRWKWLLDEGKIGLKMGIKERGRFEGRRTSRRQVRADVRTVF